LWARLESALKIVVYFCSLLVTIFGIALVCEFGLEQLLPDTYRGYLVEENGENVKWALGPFEPSQPASGFNSPIKLEKPDDTIRVISLGDSGTEGWLTAKTVFNKYNQKWEPKSLSSYSRAIEFSMNAISDSSSKTVEVINLGIAAYNITDVIRMLKDSLKLDPDLFLIQIGGNETWTGERSKWPSFLDDDIPYLYSEISYEILSEVKAGWATLDTGSDAFNPLALFNSRPQPIVLEPPGRAAGIEPRLKNYRSELERLGAFLERKEITVLFLIPSQNISDYLPFGSMAKSETSDKKLETLNQLLIAALAEPGSDSKEKYLEILSIDDGIAEANFQLGKIYLLEKKTNKAREHFWKANDRDLILKRLPSAFHDISRNFVKKNAFPFLDVMKFYESKGSSGVVGYNFLDDDVHPNREAQLDLANEIVRIIINSNLLQSTNYYGDLNKLPTFDHYNDWTGFDQESVGSISYLKAAHNYSTFGRYRQRLRWDPKPDQLLAPVIDNLDIANNYAPSDESLYFSAILNLFIGRQENVEITIGKMNCNSSVERSAQVHSKMINAFWQILGNNKSHLNQDLRRMLASKGCNQ